MSKKTTKRREQRKRAKIAARWDALLKSDSFVILDVIYVQEAEHHVISNMVSSKLAMKTSQEQWELDNPSMSGSGALGFTLGQLEWLEYRYTVLTRCAKYIQDIVKNQLIDNDDYTFNKFTLVKLMFSAQKDRFFCHHSNSHRLLLTYKKG